MRENKAKKSTEPPKSKDFRDQLPSPCSDRSRSRGEDRGREGKSGP